MVVGAAAPLTGLGVNVDTIEGRDGGGGRGEGGGSRPRTIKYCLNELGGSC